MLNRRAFSVSLALGTCAAGSAVAQQATPSGFVPNHPMYAASLQLMAERRWRDLVSSLTELPPQSALTLLKDIGDGSPLGDNLDALSRVRGGAGIAGAILVGWAWRYRGSNVAIENEDGFARHLVSSAQLLMRVIERDPADGVAASFLFQVLKGAGETQALRDLLPVYLAAERKPVEGLAAYADAISAKWTGSEVESLAFARRYAGSAPAASFGLIADVHLTSAVARLMSDDAQVVAGAAGYFAQPAVVSEITDAHERFLAGPADTDRFAVLLAHAQFSLAFLEIGDIERARLHLAAQDFYAGGPWRYMENPQAGLAQARAALGIGQT